MGLIVSLVPSGVGALNKTTWSMIVAVLLLPHGVQYVWNLFLLTLMLFGFCTGLIAHRSILHFQNISRLVNAMDAFYLLMLIMHGCLDAILAQGTWLVFLCWCLQQLVTSCASLRGS